MMKHFLLASLFPALLTAQTMQLTEQLGKTVLYSDVALSPDGKNVAWVQSTAATTSKQTYVREASENSPATMINLAMIGDRTDADPAWSPDSKTLAFFSTAGEKDQKQLWTVNSDGLTPKKLTKLSGYAPGPRDNNWWIAQIHKIDIAKGIATSIYRPSLQVAVPRWSPDGKSVAFIEGLMSDEGFHGGDLFTIATDGGGLINRAPGRKTSVSSLFWHAPERILITEYVGGGGAISELSVANNSVRTIWKGPESFHAFGNFPDFALAKDGKFAAVVRSSYEAPPEVWAGRIGEWRQLTKNNGEISATWGKAENVEWTNEGFNVQGWLLPPAKVESGKKYPMVVLIHGGPSSATTPEWPASFGMSRAIIAALSVRGYYVFLPNPRGSYGQGAEFTRANVKDFGGGDLRDSMAGIDAVTKKYPIDSARLGVTGWSYGGFMTMWTVTQTNHFRAAVAGAGIANWQSYYGQNLIDQWMIPFFGASVYDDPAAYEKSSPIHYIKKVKTPTLVIVGERDAECPAPQSYEFWHALRTLGIPTQLVVHPGEGHLYIKPDNQTDRLDRTVAWFDNYLK